LLLSLYYFLCEKSGVMIWDKANDVLVFEDREVAEKAAIAVEKTIHYESDHDQHVREIGTEREKSEGTGDVTTEHVEKKAS
jgi:hypothetical protein